jgi:hypothetical protein
MQTAARKFAAFQSKRVATRLKLFGRQQIMSSENLNVAGSKIGAGTADA